MCGASADRRGGTAGYARQEQQTWASARAQEAGPAHGVARTGGAPGAGPCPCARAAARRRAPRRAPAALRRPPPRARSRARLPLRAGPAAPPPPRQPAPRSPAPRSPPRARPGQPRPQSRPTLARCRPHRPPLRRWRARPRPPFCAPCAFCASCACACASSLWPPSRLAPLQGPHQRRAAWRLPPHRPPYRHAPRGLCWGRQDRLAPRGSACLEVLLN